jgi:hypothetical protein
VNNHSALFFPKKPKAHHALAFSDVADRMLLLTKIKYCVIKLTRAVMLWTKHPKRSNSGHFLPGDLTVSLTPPDRLDDSQCHMIGQLPT